MLYHTFLTAVRQQMEKRLGLSLIHIFVIAPEELQKPSLLHRSIRAAVPDRLGRLPRIPEQLKPEGLRVADEHKTGVFLQRPLQKRKALAVHRPVAPIFPRAKMKQKRQLQGLAAG